MGYYDQILNSTITGAGAGAGVGGGVGALVGGGLGLMSGIMAGDPAVNQIRQQQRLNELQIAGNIELANYSQNLQKVNSILLRFWMASSTNSKCSLPLLRDSEAIYWSTCLITWKVLIRR